MNIVTFTPEQIKEIHRRIQNAYEECSQSWLYPPNHKYSTDSILNAILSAFPIQKITRFRTFTRKRYSNDVDVYRVNNNKVECGYSFDIWMEAVNGANTSEFARYLAASGEWDTLIAFADICKNPTEEVDA